MRRRMMPTGGRGRPACPQSKGTALIAGFRWLTGWLMPGLTWLFRGVYKVVMRLFTGRGELERILTAGHHTRDMTNHFSRYLRMSKKLVDVKNMVFRTRARFSVEQVATMIVARKNVAPESRHFRARFLPNLAACLTQLNGTNAALAAAERLRIATFQTVDEPMLNELWKLIVSDRLPGRVSEEWKRLGFQGTDPVSDLRGNGMLGLHNLLYLARTHNQVCRAIVAESDLPTGLPLAITSINMTTFVMEIIEERLLDTFFESLGEVEDPAYALDMFNQVFGLVFVLFPPFFRASRPRDLMDFPRIYGHFRVALRAAVTTQHRVPDALPVV